MKRLAVFLSFITATACAQTEPAFYKGADLSMVQALEYQGVRYRENGLPADPLAIFQEHGCNAVRLRLFVNPNGRGGQVNTLPYTLALARRVKKMGFHFLLDFHYSDRWADPGHQLTPAAWSGLSHEQLADRLFIYTRDTLAAFQQENCLPDMVQVGNEITDGMLAPDAWPLSDASNWGNFAGLLNAAIRGVRTYPGIKVMIHVDHGGDKTVCKWFFDHLREEGVSFDLIGLSYYPLLNGPPDNLRDNLAFLSRTYGKDLIVVETGFEQQGGSPAAQKAYLDNLFRIVAATPGGRGKGLFYWAPEWIVSPGWKGAKWPPILGRALFDPSGNVLPAIDAFEFEPARAAKTP